MFRKIALGTVLAIGSISGAFAFANIGAIETPSTYVQTSAGYEALAAATRHAKPVRRAQQPMDHYVPTHTMTGYDPARDVSDY